MRVLCSEILASQEKHVEVEDVIATVSVTKNYDVLCEFSHPNGIGTFFMFGQPENEDIGQDLARSRLIGLTKSATWHGTYMLKALNASVDQSDQYFSSFDPGPSRN